VRLCSPNTPAHAHARTNTPTQAQFSVRVMLPPNFLNDTTVLRVFVINSCSPILLRVMLPPNFLHTDAHTSTHKDTDSHTSIECASVGVFVRACACAGVLGAHKNQHRKVEAHTQNCASASRLGKIGRQHRKSRKLGGRITPRKIGRQELITNTRKTSCIIQKIGRRHYAHRKLCECGRVCACVSVCVYWAYTKTSTESVRRTHKIGRQHHAQGKLGGSIARRENWAAASRQEKLGGKN